MLIDAPPQDLSTSAHSAVIAGFALLAATASIVAASITRQEYLSGRTRNLTNELREIATKVAPNQIGRNRLRNLPQQIKKFRTRLNIAVLSHLCLYVALAIETAGFGVGFYAALKKDMGNSTFEKEALKFIIPPFTIALIFLLIGIVGHIVEYSFSFKTMNLEMEDIFGFKKKRLFGFKKKRLFEEQDKQAQADEYGKDDGYAGLIKENLDDFLEARSKSTGSTAP